MVITGVNHVCFHLFILISIFTISQSQDPDCVYSVYVKTGSISKGGTDSIISLNLYDKALHVFQINNLKTWGGLMDPGYSYFESENLDMFTGKGACLPDPVCSMNLTSDGSGPGWYCNYVTVTTAGVHRACTQQNFTVEQWLATDAAPFSLTAVRNNCGKQMGIVDCSESSSLLGEM